MKLATKWWLIDQTETRSNDPFELHVLQNVAKSMASSTSQLCGDFKLAVLLV